MERMNKRTLAGVSALALIAAAGSAAAQEFDLGEIVVQGGLEASGIDETGAVVEIVTEDDLAATGETRVIDYLARLPGVSIRQRGSLGGVGALTIRGVSQNNIAVRIDGIDVSDPSGPQVAYDFGGLTTSDISRIEVLKGSQSALYGSEAMGGVINITTRRATEDGVSQTAAMEYGSYATFKGAYSVAARGEGYDFALTQSWVQTDGYSAGDENDGNDEADGFEARRLSFAAEFAMTTAASLELSAFTEQSTFDYDEAVGGIPFDGTPDDVTDRDQRGLRAALNLSMGGVDYTAELTRYEIDRTQSGTTRFGAATLGYNGTRRTAALRGAADIGTNARVIAGIERTVEDYTTNFNFGGFIPPQENVTTTINAIYAELDLALSEDVDVTATLRHDDRSDFGGFTTGRLAAVWRVQDDLLLRASVANGFRAPSPYELTYESFIAGFDEEELSPETSRSFELGLEKRYGASGTVGATLFYITADDIIDYDGANDAFVQLDGTVTRRGLELSTAWAFEGGLAVSGNYTYTESESDAPLSSSGWLASAPKHALSASITAPLTERIDLTVTGLYEAGRETLDDYGVVNATATYAISQGAEVYVRVENLMDTEYQTVEGYGTSDRAVFAGIRASF